MNIRSALIFGSEQIKKMKIDQSDLETEEILSLILGKSREYLFTYPEKNLNFYQAARFKRLIGNRTKGVPLAYLTGHQGFYGLDFKVNKNVLIPRPETELMVEEVLRRFRHGRRGIISTWEKKIAIKNIIDLGTGSGCVIISLAKNLSGHQIKYWGLDISRAALGVARQNARLNGVGGRINFLYSNLLNVIDKNIFKQPTIITANLPYLTAAQIKRSPDLRHEPQRALLSGVDGLDHYRRLFQQINKRFGLHKRNIIIYGEIDESQKAAMDKLIRDNFPACRKDFLKDLGGYDRLFVIES